MKMEVVSVGKGDDGVGVVMRDGDDGVRMEGEGDEWRGSGGCRCVGTPMATKHLDADLSGTLVDQTKYHSMVGALMYLTTIDQILYMQHVIVLAIKRD
ncbi:hypothetical protein Tco_0792669 [Tanacetum coccineum]